MAFRLRDEHRAIREAVREFGENELRPVAREYSENGQYPRELVRDAGDLGFLAPHIPIEYGGPGLDALGSILVTEELWRADTDLGRAVSITGVGTGVLTQHAAEWMKEEWLPKIASGDAIAAIAISESGGGSDVAAMQTRADRNGSEYVLNGQKMWITNGSVADVAIVFAKTDPDAGREGISTFLVPTDVDGVHANELENMMGHHAADVAELVFDDVRVPADNRIGAEGDGFRHVLDYLPFGRVDVAAQAVGAAQASLDEAVEYAGEREQFGQKIGGFQAIQHKIATMVSQVESARSLTYRAATMLDDDHPQHRLHSNVAKLHATEAACEVADEAIQIHGGAGYVTDHPVEKYYRDVRATRIYEGTNEVLKNLIAREFL